MSNCIPSPPCEGDEPLVCEPYGTVTTGNRVMVEDDAFCSKTIETPSVKSALIWDNGVKWKKDNSAILPTYADNASAIAGGLIVNDIYKTAAGELRIVV